MPIVVLKYSFGEFDPRAYVSLTKKLCRNKYIFKSKNAYLVSLSSDGGLAFAAFS